jgi:hypothetical protein
MKRKKIIWAIIIVAVAGIAAISNPSEESHKDAVKMR